MTHFAGGGRGSVSRRSRRVVPGLEALEDRLVLDGGSHDPTQILVRFRAGASPRAALPARAVLGEKLPLVAGLHEVRLTGGLTVARALRSLRNNPAVLFAEPDWIISLQTTPNDASFGTQWDLNNTGQGGGTIDADIDAPEAWDVSTGHGLATVAVLDTGIDYTHPDLAANVWTNPNEVAGNGLDDDGNGYIDDVHGWDFVNNDANPMDDNSHGTHAAGTIGAVGNNGLGVAGVIWDVRLMALKFLDAGGSGSTSNAIQAVNYAVMMGAKISNNSWGGGGYSSSLANAIANARANGHVFVAAAGNNGSNNDATAFYPAGYNYDNVVAVAATDRYDMLASYSNYGATAVDLAAPGTSIYSTLPNNAYGYKSGTSMATPHVAGALALVWDQHPGWTYSQVISQVLQTVDTRSSLSGKVATGGRLNLAAALGDTTPPSDTTGPRVTGTSLLGDATAASGFRLTFSEPIDPTTFTTGDATLTNPGGGGVGITSVAVVAGSNNTQFDVRFGTQTTAGTYQFAVGPDVRDAAGNRMDQNQNGTPGEAADKYATSFTITGSRTFSSTDGPKAVRDLQTTVSTITIDEDFTIADLNVKLNVGHTAVGNLYVTLRAPDGTVVVLSNRRGGKGDHFQDTVLDDEASIVIANGSAPFAGSFRADGLLSVFDGTNARGTWELRVEDRQRRDEGTLNDWSLTLG